MMEQEEEQEDYSIADVEKKVKELKNAVLKIGYEILSKMDKHEEISPELMAEQKLREKQYIIFNKMLTQTKKEMSYKGNNPLNEILNSIGEVKVAMADIQQKII